MLWGEAPRDLNKNDSDIKTSCQGKLRFCRKLIQPEPKQNDY
jgi:hypothetical protein